jgi:hypothetical protein
VKGLNPNDKIEDLYIESPPFAPAAEIDGSARLGGISECSDSGPLDPV